MLARATLPIFIHPHPEQLADIIKWQGRIQSLLQHLQLCESQHPVLMLGDPCIIPLLRFGNMTIPLEYRGSDAYFSSLRALWNLDQSLLTFLPESHPYASRALSLLTFIHTERFPGTNSECVTYHHTPFCVIKPLSFRNGVRQNLPSDNTDLSL